jgi:hypothetical protein
LNLICWLGNELSEQVITNVTFKVTFNSYKYILRYPKSLHLYTILQAEGVRDAAWGCDWVGTPVPFQRCLAIIIATANKEFTLTAGKFVPVTNKTMMHVSKCYSEFS